MKKQKASDTNQWTILNLLKWATGYLKKNGIEESKTTAEILLAHSLHLQRIDLYLQHDRPLEKQELSQFKTLLKRKMQREPVAYITGDREFWSLPIAVTRDVLIPRPETERLAEAALDVIKGRTTDLGLRVLELGTGSGALIIALAFEHENVEFYASDISLKALAVAKQNATGHGLKNIQFFAGNWMAPLSTAAEGFDMILSNPPYIRRNEMERLAPEIRLYEPRSALDGGEDGLRELRHIVQNARAYLKPGGHLLLEIGYDQKADVMAIVTACGQYQSVRVFKDYGGHDRVLQLQRGAAGDKTHPSAPALHR
jgi:release factor glutamine methyltransferase